LKMLVVAARCACAAGCGEKRRKTSTAADHKPFLGRALSTFCVRCFAVFCNFSLFPSKVENS